jgi:hypothetical protein
MTVNERVMSPVAGRQGPAEHDVIVVGNLTVDDVVYPTGETTMASPGGNTIYAATGALIWGLSVGVVARVGAGFPVAALDRLRDAGLDTGGLRPIEGPTVRNWVICGPTRSRTAHRWSTLLPCPSRPPPLSSGTSGPKAAGRS